MRTSGKGNETLLTLIPLGVLLVFGTWMAGGPWEALQLINSTVGSLAEAAAAAVSAMVG
jgi:hypothetical protein